MTGIEGVLNAKLEPNKTLTLRSGEVLEAYIPTGFHENHAPSMLELESGDILAVWFAGGTEEGRGDIKIATSRLIKDELTWSDPILVSDDYTRSEQNPMLFQAPDGKLLLMYTAQEARTMSRKEFEALHPGAPFTMQETSVIRMKVSEDEGVTWGPFTVFSDKAGSFCRTPIVEMSNGEWIVAMWYSVLDGGATHYGSDYSVVKISSDQGKSWHEHEIQGSRGRVHASLIETEQGHLVAFFRSRSADRIYVSHSDDYGRSWTEPERTVLPNNNSSIRAIPLLSGKIAIIFNHTHANEDPTLTVWPRERVPVTVALSEDGGATWPYMRNLENGESFCGEANKHLNRRYEYPWLLQTKNGLIHASYAYGSRKCIKHVVFKENWITGI